MFKSPVLLPGFLFLVNHHDEFCILTFQNVTSPFTDWMVDTGSRIPNACVRYDSPSNT